MNCRLIHIVENDHVNRIYWRAEQNYRKYSRTIGSAVVAYMLSTYLFDFVYSIYCICSGNTNVAAWPVPIELSVPFDTETIPGWYLLLLCGTSLDSAYFICLLLGTTQFIGSCIYISAICQHFDVVMQTDQIDRNSREDSPQKLDAINGEICRAIQIQVEINE